MLVYGDHSETADSSARLERIAEQIAAVANVGAGIGRHARLVGALIDVGQLLQGIADADFGALGADRRTPGIDALSGYTCAIAGAVCRSWDSGFSELGELPAAPQIEELPSPVELRTPEGFAFYGVYPAAY